MTISEKIVDFCFNSKYENLSEKVIELVKIDFADLVGITCLGAESPAAGITAEYVKSIDGAKQAPVVRKNMRAPLAMAGMINSQQAHIDDFDDNGIPGHVSSVIGGTVLALAEYCNVSGKDLIRAYALGMEVEFRIADVLMDELLKQGFCCSPVFGGIGSVVTAAIMLGLDKEQFVNAIAIVCSNISGVTVNFGSACKPYQIGLASASGIEAALMAQLGLDGRPDCIEGKGGYSQVYCGKEITSDDIDFSTGHWLIADRGVVLKQYPSCLGAHGAVMGLFKMLEAGEIKADEVEHINAGVCWLANRALAYTEPETVTEARFSMNFALANVLERRYFGLKSFEEDIVHDPRIRETMKKITREQPEELKDIYADESMPTILTITLKDGTVIRKESHIPRIGPAGEDISDLVKRIRGKFIDCTDSFLSDADAGQLFDRILCMEKENDLDWLLTTIS